MIPILSLALYTLTHLTAVAAQSCSSVTITSQSDVSSAFSDCSTIDGSVTISPSAQGTLDLSGLEKITESLIVENTSLNGLTAPDLESIGGDITVSDNDPLNRLGLASVATIGGDLNVKGNNALVDLSMDDLETLRGGMFLDGGFNTLSFDNLDTVGSKSEIVATGSAGCSGIDSLNSSGGEEDGNGSGVFQGDYTCATTTPSASASPSSSAESDASPTESDSASAGGGSSGLSGGAIAGIVIGAVVGVIIILILIWLFLRERKKNRAGAGSGMDAAAVGAGMSTGAAAAMLARKPGKGNEEKQASTTDSGPTSPSGDGSDAGAGAGAVTIARSGTERGVIPRRPVSTATALTNVSPTSTDPSSTNASSGLPSSLTAGSTNASSMPVPTALIPGTSNGAARDMVGRNDSLFIAAGAGARPGPARRPSESDVPMLDSEDVHEISGISTQNERAGRAQTRVVGEGTVFELDGGFEGARHMRAIHDDR